MVSEVLQEIPRRGHAESAERPGPRALSEAKFTWKVRPRGRSSNSQGSTSSSFSAITRSHLQVSQLGTHVQGALLTQKPPKALGFISSCGRMSRSPSATRRNRPLLDLSQQLAQASAAGMEVVIA